MFTFLANWLKAARWHASVLHLLEMWVVIIPVYLATQSKPACAASVIAWYWSRKMTEVREIASPGDVIDVGALGWFPWDWPWDMQLDLFVPAAAVILLAVA